MIAEETTPNAAFNGQPKKFVTWLFVLSSLMCFAGLTSAYIVRKAEGNWKIFDLPQAFYYTTVLILLSSLTLHLSLTNAKKGQIAKQKNYLVITIILGLGFLLGQYFAWKQLVANGIYFAGNPAESFLYVISCISYYCRHPAFIICINWHFQQNQSNKKYIPHGNKHHILALY
jgi:heme/copper-type cytochrome/quinol oxidase subunit 3